MAREEGTAMEPAKAAGFLGVELDAGLSKAEVIKAYKRAASKYHPDRYATASDETKKKAERAFRIANQAKKSLLAYLEAPTQSVPPRSPAAATKTTSSRSHRASNDNGERRQTTARPPVGSGGARPGNGFGGGDGYTGRQRMPNGQSAGAPHYNSSRKPEVFGGEQDFEARGSRDKRFKGQGAATGNWDQSPSSNYTPTAAVTTPANATARQSQRYTNAQVNAQVNMGDNGGVDDVFTLSDVEAQLFSIYEREAAEKYAQRFESAKFTWSLLTSIAYLLAVVATFTARIVGSGEAIGQMLTEALAFGNLAVIGACILKAAVYDTFVSDKLLSLRRGKGSVAWKAAVVAAEGIVLGAFAGTVGVSAGEEWGKYTFAMMVFFAVVEIAACLVIGSQRKKEQAQ